MPEKSFWYALRSRMGGFWGQSRCGVFAENRSLFIWSWARNITKWDVTREKIQIFPLDAAISLSSNVK
jgi:hypothetical protein